MKKELLYIVGAGAAVVMVTLAGCAGFSGKQAAVAGEQIFCAVDAVEGPVIVRAIDKATGQPLVGDIASASAASACRSWSPNAHASPGPAPVPVAQ